ncbi:hypothetical protein [[Mycoplasma] collis]|nr:hypothetical protein [[Mycoplasma] collis]
MNFNFTLSSEAVFSSTTIVVTCGAVSKSLTLCLALSLDLLLLQIK